MAYNPNSAMEKIYNFKNMWSDAAAKGDEAGKNNAATKAQEYYASLRDNGYGDVANKLSASGLDQSRKYIDNFYAMSGRQQTRPYFYGKGQKYGLSQADIDKALSFNETTGEVSLGGKNIGRPAAISSDGYSYYDSDALDKAFDDYVKTIGATESIGTIAKQGTADLMGMNKQLFDTTMKDHDTINGTNPLDTAVGKAIMEKYGLMGYTGRQNALASGAASNGGNVDSYSAANAMRQQAALNSMGATAAIDAYNSQVQNAGTRLDQARATLQQMGVNINDAVANNETMLNGEVDRNETVLNGKMNRAAQESDITGVQPRYITNRQNRYFDENGNLKDAAGNNFADIVYALRGELENTKDENRRKQIEQNIEEALAAGNYKVTMPEYSQYATEWARQFPTAGAFTAKPTEDARQFDAAMQNSLDVLKVQNQQETDMANLNSQNAIEQANVASQNAINEANNATDNAIRANTAATNDSIRASQATSGTSGTSGVNDGPTQVELPEGNTVEDWVKWLNSECQKAYEKDAIGESTLGKYTPINGSSEWIVKRVLQNHTLTDVQKNELLNQLGVKPEVVRTVIGDGHNRTYEDGTNLRNH